jgi:tetratricopeptide (TPR) repeat protein
MSTSSVVRLDEIRVRRHQRLRESSALYGGDPERSRVASILEQVIGIVEADRAATVWIDEYGTGMVHVHCVLDLVRTPSRRSFDPQLLQSAWEEGVPGLRDCPELSLGHVVPLMEGVRSAAAVALGSDGARSWFVVVDSNRPRQELSGDRAGLLMYLAGECAAILLHRELPLACTAEDGASDFERRRRTSFGGWPILQDIEGREADDDANRRIAARFLVGRLVRGLLEEEFAVEREAVLYRAAGVRRELGTVSMDDPERQLWERVVTAVEEENPDLLAGVLLELGSLVERQGHLFGAREFHRTAYEVAVIGGDSSTTADAARFHARACRKLGDLVESRSWYETALRISRAREDQRVMAVVLDGLANTFREMGELVRSREVVEEGMEVALALDDRYAVASFHHTLLSLDRFEGRWSEAIVNGWQAVGLYAEPYHQALALLDLAGVFVDVRQFRSADDAYAVVEGMAPNRAVTLMAISGRAYTAAMDGDVTLFELHSARLDATEWMALPPAFRTQIELYRGMALAELGRARGARSWLERARGHAELHQLRRLVDEANLAIEALRSAAPVPKRSFAPAEAAIRVMRELGAARQRVASA